jgi:uncharacterized membrane protein YraQ (UPF0718 family)/copper chaperone CopZ
MIIQYIKLFTSEIWTLVVMMAPYLLLGMFFSGLISIFIDKGIVLKHIGAKNFKSIFKSTIFGVPLPLCSCGVIPVAATLKESGASKGATIAFLVSTPQTGFDSIFLTYGMLGPVLAIYRPFAALISGLLSGVFINEYDDEDHHHSTTSNRIETINIDFLSKVISGIKYGFYTLPKDIVVPLVQGILVAGIISVLIPPGFVADIFTSKSNFMYLMMLLVSLPLYVCATASIPIGLALMSKGLSAGAVFVFLMAGPATNAASINVVKNILGKKTMYYYLALISLTAVFFGFILDSFMFISVPDIMHQNHIHSMDSIGSLIMTIIFLLILVNSYFFNYGEEQMVGKNKNGSINSQDETLINVQGMTCSHCKESVESVTASCEGVVETYVDLSTGDVKIVGNAFNIDDIKEKIINRGFKISP